ncbi:hypothetical protein, partial [Sutterella massiliensis]|uniref:hypothetical protein n=1 Tax=Sutterella massiliensis TaxID=1816689 RepID=UPI001961A9D2
QSTARLRDRRFASSVFAAASIGRRRLLQVARLAEERPEEGGIELRAAASKFQGLSGNSNAYFFL